MPKGWPQQQKAPESNRVARWLGGAWAAVKAAAGDSMHFSTLGGSGSQWWYDSRPAATTAEVSAAVGNGSGTSIVEAVTRWIMRNLTGAPIALRRTVAAGETQPVPFHPLLDILAEPNPAYDGTALLRATAGDLVIDGNGYWWIIPTSLGRPAQLWWIPTTLIEPKWDPQDDTVFVTHYEYKPGGGRVYEIPPEQIIHFRDGIDPYNTRKGASALKSVLREVYTDQEAALFTSTILANMGVPGTIITPTTERGPTPEEAETVKKRFDSITRGKGRGATIVMGQPSTVEQFGFSPEQLSLKEMRRLPEERISAVTGVPAIVAGLGAGLDRSTFANYAEAREAGYEECIIPMQGLIASTLRRALLSMYVDDLRGWEVYFDTSDVRILQEDQSKLAERMVTLVNGSILMRAEARRELGYEADEADEVYHMPINVVEVRPGESDEEGEPAAALPAEVTSEVQALALNGAQISSLLELLNSVANGTLSPEAVSEIIAVAFPAIPAEQIDRLVRSAAASRGTPAPEPLPEQLGA